MPEKFVIESDFIDGKRMILQPNDNNDSVRFIIQDQEAGTKTDMALTPQQVYMLCSMATTLANRRYIDENRKNNPVYFGLGAIPDELKKAMENWNKVFGGKTD